MTREEIESGLDVLCAGFNRKRTAAMVTAYFAVLKDVPKDHFKARIKAALARSDSYWPPPGYFLPGGGEAAADGELEARLVFEDIVKRGFIYSNRGTGPRYYRLDTISVEWGDAAADVFRAIGGSDAVRDADHEGMRYLARDFARLYPAAKAKEERRAAYARRIEAGAGGATRLPNRRLQALPPARDADSPEYRCRQEGESISCVDANEVVRERGDE